MGKYKSDVQIVFVLTFFPFRKISLIKLKYLFSSLLSLLIVLIQFHCSTTVRNGSGEKKKTPLPAYRIVPGTKDQIRVLLSEDNNTMSVSVKGSYNLFSDNETIGELKNGDKLVFKINGGGANIIFNNREIDGITFLLQPSDSESVILFSGKKYADDILVVYSDNNKLLLVNRLPMDDYLPGVLHPEMAVKENQTDRYEALKAFSVCARTFAEMKKVKGNTYYDISDDVRDQVFDGSGNCTEMDKKAVNETSGDVLKYKEKLAEIFYHSACGGTLEDPANVFSGKVDDYLFTKKDGDEKPNCEISPTFAWKESYTSSEILKLLKAKNLLTKKQMVVTNIEISDAFASERVKELRISFDKADDVVLHGPEIRNVFTRKDSKGILRSSLFTLTKERTKKGLKKITFEGKGSGHGVGLCQWGSMYLSSTGKNYKEILDFYFTGCTIGKIE